MGIGYALKGFGEDLPEEVYSTLPGNLYPEALPGMYSNRFWQETNNVQKGRVTNTAFHYSVGHEPGLC